MSLKKLIYLVFLILPVLSNSRCLDRIELRNYSDYKFIKTAFVYTIIDRKEEKNGIMYTAQVVRSFKGSASGIIKIKKHRYFGSCDYGVNMYLGQVAILVTDQKSDLFAIDECSYVVDAKTEGFDGDTTFFHEFGKTNGFVDLPIANGQLVNGVQQGHWKLYHYVNNYNKYIPTSEGDYKNGEEFGIWIRYNYYNPTEFKTDTVEYSNGSWSATFRRYHPNGALYSNHKFTNGERANSEIYYRIDGTISAIYEYDNEKLVSITDNDKELIYKCKVQGKERTRSIYSLDNKLLKQAVEISNKGTFYEYHQNGIVKTKFHFKNREIKGKIINFDETGKIVSEMKIIKDKYGGTYENLEKYIGADYFEE